MIVVVVVVKDIPQHHVRLSLKSTHYDFYNSIRSEQAFLTKCIGVQDLSNIREAHMLCIILLCIVKLAISSSTQSDRYRKSGEAVE